MNLEKNKQLGTQLSDEDTFLLELKAKIKQGKEELREGNFITHEEMLLKLEKEGLIKKSKS
ncbi:hypothetical protein [Flavobacterium branchiicola]|uniref:Uncharacterized protein n=1 Tax=Flavobacterium branchiicola TaxID=1114875 RepID=A0ABV9PHP1_9FLAO|nr:hypothetical protein [Flavobacterium branchiicola]MBS7255010.1 hypothetical protein [Flavobacterium branchiicola]